MLGFVCFSFPLYIHLFDTDILNFEILISSVIAFLLLHVCRVFFWFCVMSRCFSVSLSILIVLSPFTSLPWLAPLWAICCFGLSCSYWRPCSDVLWSFLVYLRKQCSVLGLCCTTSLPLCEIIFCSAGLSSPPHLPLPQAWSPARTLTPSEPLVKWSIQVKWVPYEPCTCADATPFAS